jgi:SAM-dependent methyltransferase
MTMADISVHALRFGRAAAGYESQATIQARMAGILVDLWGDRAAPHSILEFGCGTGLLTDRLVRAFPESVLLATDASQGMLEAAMLQLHRPGRLDFSEQDAEGSRSLARVVAARAPYDLIASGALVQWFPDLERHLRFAASLAAPAGHYLVSGFARKNFPELNALLSEPPFSYTRFPGHDPEVVEKAAVASGWNVLSLLDWEEKEILPSPRQVLRRLQDLGSVRDPREGGRMNRDNLEFLLKEYGRRFAETGDDGEGVRLTWRPWAALLQKSG